MIGSELYGQLIVTNSRWTSVRVLDPGNSARSVCASCRSALRATGSRSSPGANALQNPTSADGSPRLTITAGTARRSSGPVNNGTGLDRRGKWRTNSGASRDRLPRSRPRPEWRTDRNQQNRSVGTSPLLARAEERIASLPVPGGELVLVHGDLWQGNTIWSGDSCSGMIDWDAAGAGSPGIDLGTLRLDVALFFGSSALESPGESPGPGSPPAGEVLAGWQHAAGRQARDVAYWDVAAGLCTVSDMAYCLPGDLVGELGPGSDRGHPHGPPRRLPGSGARPARLLRGDTAQPSTIGRPAAPSTPSHNNHSGAAP